MENEKNKTLVNGKETGDFTESGNFRHNSDGTFAFSKSSKIPDNFVWDNAEWEKVKDKDIKELKNKSKIKKIEDMSTEELIKEIKDCEIFLSNYFLIIVPLNVIGSINTLADQESFPLGA